MIRVINDSLGRALHPMLYDRLLNFCTQYTPELPGEPVVQSWLDRLYKGDNNLHILVELDTNFKIITHFVIDIQEIYGCRIALCHQVQTEKGVSPSLWKEGIEYLDKFAQAAQAICTVIYVTKNIKVLEKQYGYKVSRTMMIKSYGGGDETDE